MTRATETLSITPEQIKQYQEEGYFILEKVLSDDVLDVLRSECDRLVAETDAAMAAKGEKSFGINHQGNRYFISQRHRDSEKLQQFLISDPMVDICRATLGPDAYMFVDQFVVKAAEVGMEFAWHQDSGYVGHDHRPYMSCWCALDDVSEENGTVFILPYSRAGTRTRVDHQRKEDTSDLVGYHGDDPGIPVIIPAGGIAVFSSTAFHRSTPNTTSKPRRVYLAQYSAEPVMSADGQRLWASAKPVLKDGEAVGVIDLTERKEDFR